MSLYTFTEEEIERLNEEYKKLKEKYDKLMNITIVDYSSGNISSVINSFNDVCKNKYKINFKKHFAPSQTIRASVSWC